MFKRILCVFCSVVMVFSMISPAVYADDEIMNHEHNWVDVPVSLKGEVFGMEYQVSIKHCTICNLSNFKSRTLENTGIFSVFGASALPFSLIFSLTGENKGKFFLYGPYHFVEQPCGSPLGFSCGVGVNVHRGTYICVSEKFLHILGCGSAG